MTATIVHVDIAAATVTVALSDDPADRVAVSFALDGHGALPAPEDVLRRCQEAVAPIVERRKMLAALAALPEEAQEAFKRALVGRAVDTRPARHYSAVATVRLG